ncbi:hypothetical protein GCM10011506_24450 [Marivirga lumbricoides]|uniref:Fibronectin type III domain-containing protein n=2 Tax=Marivirga lumbricoides TaxID=1046115 RepID=A0ABQ1MFJ0_9BACT|nr:hypothetical protein GCM10011506_24450 [Marivirga lumbricoides]
MNHLGKILLAIFAFGSCGAYAQINPDTLKVQPSVEKDTVIAFQSEVFAIAKYTGNSIILRWSPDQAGGWHVGNQLGYMIERTEIKSDSTYNPEKFEAIVNQPVKPWPLEEWKKIAGEGKDKYAAIAAQSLYGEGYNTGGLLDKADEFKNRYSFALLSADFSPETAEALGLRFEDVNIEKNKVYIYRIFLAEESKNYKIDTAYQVVNTSKVFEMPEVAPSKILEEELKVSFYWDRAIYDQYYSAYYIERSSDGENFQRLNEQPYVNALSEEFAESHTSIVYSDSLEQNYKVYYYRILGLSPFGEISKPSQPFKAMGRDRTPPSVPYNIESTPVSSSRVKIKWQKDKEEKDLLGYVVSRSQDFKGTFVPLFDKPLKPGTREFIDKTAVEMGTNYYMVSALDTAGNISNSLISFAPMIDSIPPAAPTGLQGKIDSTGLVTLTWKLGAEKNIKGYNLYFSNAKDHVFTTVNNHPIQDTVYTDTVQVKTLTEEIFYCLIAVDVNFNRSVSSDTLRLKRPDFIPPTSPVFTDFKVDRGGIEIYWGNSSSKDAEEYLLLRSTGDQAFSEIQRFKAIDEVVQYKDLDVESGVIYSYSLITIDNDGLQSTPAYPLKIKMRQKEKAASLSDIAVSKNDQEGSVDLSWNYMNNSIHAFVLYRAVDGRNFKSYKTFSPETKSFSDYFVKEGSRYEYTLKVQLKSGQITDFGEVVAVQF